MNIKVLGQPMMEFLTPKEFMARHNLARTTVYEGIRDGSIPSITISKRKILIPADALSRKLNGDRTEG